MLVSFMQSKQKFWLIKMCFVFRITGSLRPYSTPIDKDELITKNLEAIVDYESDEYVQNSQNL
jgi:hypothetical protein